MGQTIAPIIPCAKNGTIGRFSASKGRSWRKLIKLIKPLSETPEKPQLASLVPLAGRATWLDEFARLCAATRRRPRSSQGAASSASAGSGGCRVRPASLKAAVAVSPGRQKQPALCFAAGRAALSARNCRLCAQRSPSGVPGGHTEASPIERSSRLAAVLSKRRSPGPVGPAAAPCRQAQSRLFLPAGAHFLVDKHRAGNSCHMPSLSSSDWLRHQPLFKRHAKRAPASLPEARRLKQGAP